MLENCNIILTYFEFTAEEFNIAFNLRMHIAIETLTE